MDSTLSYAEFTTNNPDFEPRALQIAQQLRDSGQTISLGKVIDFIAMEHKLAGVPITPAVAADSHWFMLEIHAALFEKDPTLAPVTPITRAAKRFQRRKRLDAVYEDKRVLPA